MLPSSTLRVKAWLFSATGFPGGSAVETPPANVGDVGLTPGLRRFLENEMATRSSIRA